jgi:hypothetical protein
MKFTIFDILTFGSFLMSLMVFLKKPVPFYLKLFPLSDHKYYNTGIVNVWSTIEFCFFFFIIHEIIVSEKVKRIIVYIIFLFVIFAFINIFLFQKKVGFNTVNFITGSLIIVSLCIYYFMELFQKSDVPSLSKLPAFWIVSGLLFNNVISFPQYALSSFMVTMTRANHNYYHILFDNMGAINNITVLLTSILYSIGFLCRVQINKSIS